jgi:hypothetical protein
MTASNPPLCLHCEKRPAAHALRLCETCAGFKGIRRLYRRRPHWTPEWEQHLRRLSERARRRLPLFTDESRD